MIAALVILAASLAHATESRHSVGMSESLGVWSAIDLSSNAVFEPPSDQPSLWPVLSLVWSSER